MHVVTRVSGNVWLKFSYKIQCWFLKSLLKTLGARTHINVEIATGFCHDSWTKYLGV